MLLVDISQFIPLKCKPCHEEYIARTRGDYQDVVPSENRHFRQHDPEAERVNKSITISSVGIA